MKKTIQYLVMVLLLVWGLSWAEDAPVVDVTENSTGGDQTVTSVTSPNNTDNTNPFTRSYGSDSDSSSNNQANAQDTSSANADVATDNDQNQNASSSQNAVSLSFKSMTIEQRIERLEQQVSNLVRMNLPQQIADIQQNMQQLQGQLQVQQHDLQLLSQQQRNFYQDLDHRIAQLKNASASNTGAENDNNQSPSAKSLSSNNVQMNDSNAYRSAFVLLTKKNYDQAKKAFKNYLKNYPKGHFIVSAYYWLGEINLSQKNYDEASKQFKNIITKYPNSSKVLEAKLKVAIIHANQGKFALAKKEFQAIKNQNPNTTAAQLANIHLQQLDQALQPSSS